MRSSDLCGLATAAVFLKKADIKPESRQTLDEIAKLLKENPDLKLYVVGHTDNSGISFDRLKAVKIKGYKNGYKK